MNSQTSNRRLDVFIWVVMLVLLVAGLRIGLGDVMADALTQNAGQIAPAGVERAGG